MADQNARFLAHLKKFGDQASGYLAAHFHISELPPPKKSRDHLSAAISQLASLKARFKDTEIFLLRNLDIVAVTREIPRHNLAATCASIQEVFLGKMGVSFTNTHGGLGEFYTIFDLGNPAEFLKLVAWAESVAGVAEAAAPSSGGPPANPNEPKKEADSATLARIKVGLTRTDISPMLLAQAAYNIGDADKVSVMFRENYIAVKVLENTFCPGQSLTANRWLFNDLTEDLDAAVLRLLANPEERASRRRFSINLNLSTVASDKFAKFDAELKPDQRQNVIIEINKTDMFESPRLWLKFVPRLRDRGYRVLLDSLHYEAVEFIDFNAIACDYAKMFWSGDIMRLDQDRFAKLQQRVGNRNSPQFVLARCDTAEGLRFARGCGIHILQGRLIDNMVKKGIPI
jgi:EAL domain-containing protein (putative c-di-GMP-specific phosphodiesterase class I)